MGGEQEVGESFVSFQKQLFPWGCMEDGLHSEQHGDRLRALRPAHAAVRRSCWSRCPCGFHLPRLWSVLSLSTVIELLLVIVIVFSIMQHIREVIRIWNTVLVP